MKFEARSRRQAGKFWLAWAALFRHGAATCLGLRPRILALTMLLHRFPDETPFEERIRFNQFDVSCALRSRPGVAGGAICRLAVRGVTDFSAAIQARLAGIAHLAGSTPMPHSYRTVLVDAIPLAKPC